MKMEHAEIGALIEEITAKGWTDIQTDVNDTGESRTVCVDAWNHSLAVPSGHSVTGDDLVTCLRIIVDCIRAELGEPSLDDEVNAMVVADNIHAEQRITCGPGARCACGSGILLVEKRPVLQMAVTLEDGELSFVEKPPITFSVEDGDLASCPTCGKWYRLAV